MTSLNQSFGPRQAGPEGTRPRLGGLEPLLTRALKFADFRAVYQRRSFNALRQGFYADLWARAAAKVGAVISPVSGELLGIEKAGMVTFVRRSELMLDSATTIGTFAHKGLTYRLMAARGVPMPDYLEFSLGQLAEAERFMERQTGMVVVKPATGTGSGLGVTTGIDSPCNLRRAVRYAASFNRELLVEPHVFGGSYRLLFLDGILLEAVRRDPPMVRGDGRSSIRELIRAENLRRRTGQPVTSLHPIIIDNECRDHLSRLSLCLKHCPDSGVEVPVKGAVNENASDQNHVVTGELHPDIAARAARLVTDLNVRFAGVDLISSDIGAPLDQGVTVFSEINVNPGLNHHYLVAQPGSERPVAERILDYLFNQKQGVMNVGAEA